MVARTSIPARVGRLALLGSLLLGMALLTTGVALAHANLVRSVPAANATLDVAPAEVRLWFSEPPEPRFTEVRLVDRDARAVPGVGPARPDPAEAGQAVAPLPSLPDGVYTVVWRTVSAVDGHATAGSFAFAVGPGRTVTAAQLKAAAGTDTNGSPSLLAVVIRWLGYLALALLVGGLAFSPAVEGLALVGADDRSSARDRRAAVSQPLWATPASLTLPTVGWWLSLATTLVAAIVQAATSANVGLTAAIGTPLLNLLLGTRYGAIFWLRVVLLVTLGGLLMVGRRRSAQSGWWWSGLALAVLVLLTTSLNSHAAAGPLPALQVVADWLHLTAMSIWVGGLVALILLLRAGSTDLAGRATAIAAVVARFSRVALACVVVLGITGVYRGVLETADPANLTDTAYGNALLVKLGLFLPALGLAAVNLLFVKRRLAETAVAADAGASAAPWRGLIRGTVGGEILFAAAILLATGLLVNLQPARDVYGSGLVVRGQAEDVRIVLVVSPGQAGLNRFDIYLRDSAGRPLTDAEKVALIFTMVEHDMGQTEAVANSLGDGRYVVQGGYASMVGTWHTELLVRRTGRDDARTVLTFRPTEISPAPGAANVPVVSTQTVLGLELLIGGLLLTLVARRLRRRRTVSVATLVVGASIALFGVAFAANTLTNSATPAVAVANPVPADAESVARGQEIYQANCVVCHGPNARGDGPLAGSLNRPPADLRTHVPQHRDGEIESWIADGFPGSAMPAFGSTLSERDRWDVVNHLRDLVR